MTNVSYQYIGVDCKLAIVIKLRYSCCWNTFWICIEVLHHIEQNSLPNWTIVLGCLKIFFKTINPKTIKEFN